MLKLSEAISLGAMLGPQCFGELRHGNATCAFGAAFAAMCRPTENVACRVWRWLINPQVGPRVSCPSCGQNAWVAYTITHLNDEHRWTREQIADWVATIEPQDQAEASPAAPVSETTTV